MVVRYPVHTGLAGGGDASNIGDKGGRGLGPPVTALAIVTTANSAGVRAGAQGYELASGVALERRACEHETRAVARSPAA